MTTTPVWVWLLEWAAAATTLAGHWLLQSTLVITIGLIAGRVLRSRGPALQSAVYRTTLVAAFLCPIVTGLLTTSGLTLGLSIMPEVRVAALEMLPEPTDAPAVTPPAHDAVVQPVDLLSAPMTDRESASGRQSDVAGLDTLADGHDLAPQPAAGLDGAEHVTTSIDDRGGASVAVEAAVIEPPRLQSLEMRPTWVVRPAAAATVGVVTFFWLVGGSALLMRLAVAHLSLMRLRRTAIVSGDDQLRLCCQFAEDMGAWPPAVLTTPFVSGPCLTGIRHPAILLPDELPDVPLATIFIHELAHLRRHDCLWNLLRQAVAAVLFFQPLIWRLSRLLETTAEEVCDDYVVQHGADRHSYADILVSLAERSWVPASSAVVPLVTFRSLLGHRVARILDRTRQLSLTVSLTALCLVIATGLAATLGAGVLGPTERGAASDADSAGNVDREVALETNSDDTSSGTGDRAIASVADKEAASADAVPGDDISLHYRGRVLDPDGKAAAGAKIFLLYWQYAARPMDSVKPQAMTDDDGWFDFTVTSPDFPSADEERWIYADIVATAGGYGFASRPSIDFETTGEARKRLSPAAQENLAKRLAKEEEPILNLVRDDVPITGQVRTIEGQPVAGAKIRVDRVWHSESESLDSWQEAAKNPNANFYTLRNNLHLDEVHGLQMPSIVSGVAADADGRFTLHGIGRERIVQLLVSGPIIESGLLFARTRAGEKVMLPPPGSAQHGDVQDQSVYPADFFHLAGPSHPLTGAVTDAESGAPLEGVLITSGQAGTFFSSGKPYIVTETDAAGRYRLEGLAVGQRENVYVIPPATTAYIPAGFDITINADKPAITRDLTLRRGIWVRGEVVDNRVGKSLSGRVAYYAFANNPNLDSYPGFYYTPMHYERRTDAQGRFEIAALPGPGIVAFTADDHTSFRRGQGAEAIKGTMSGIGKSFDTVPHSLLSGTEHVVREINPVVGAEPVDLKFTISSGVDVHGTVVDSAGQPLVGTIFYSEPIARPVIGAWRTIESDEFSIHGFYPDEPRDVFFYHPEHDLAGHYRLEGPPPHELAIALHPAGSIRGRVLDRDGGALARKKLTGDGVPGVKYGNSTQLLATDDDGRFHIRGLIAGRKYTVSVFDTKVSGQVLVDATVETGQTKDVGDVTLQPLEATKVGSPPSATKPPMPSADEAASTPAADDAKRDRARATGTFIPAGAQPAKATPKEPEGDLLVVNGRVVDPQGQPVAAADVLVVHYNWQTLGRTEPVATTKSDAAGHFQVEFRKSQLPDMGTTRGWQHALIAAVAPGSGPAWVAYEEVQPNEELTLGLVPDEAIEGRIVDLEGRPIRGVHVEVQNLRANKKEDLTEWLEQVRAAADPSKKNNRATFAYAAMGSRRKAEPTPEQAAAPNRILPTDVERLSYTADSDTDGRFRITGLGHDRLATLKFTGGGVVVTQLQVAVRKMDPTDAGGIL